MRFPSFESWTAAPATQFADCSQTGMETVSMLAEAQAVIAYRMLGLMGVWQLESDETVVMMIEKPEAFARSANAAMNAAASGARLDEVLSAAVAPLRHKTQSNMQRLSECGTPWTIGG